MLRTSLRIQRRTSRRCAAVPFLSSNAQDFIEEAFDGESGMSDYIFLSSNAQDFIEDPPKP